MISNLKSGAFWDTQAGMEIRTIQKMMTPFSACCNSITWLGIQVMELQQAEKAVKWFVLKTLKMMPFLLAVTPSLGSLVKWWSYSKQKRQSSLKFVKQIIWLLFLLAVTPSLGSLVKWWSYSKQKRQSSLKFTIKSFDCFFWCDFVLCNRKRCNSSTFDSITTLWNTTFSENIVFFLEFWSTFLSLFAKTHWRINDLFCFQTF